MNENDVIGMVAAKARELGDMTMDELRLTAGYGCNTPGEARVMNKGLSRGQLIEFILVEEFSAEFPREFADT